MFIKMSDMESLGFNELEWKISLSRLYDLLLESNLILIDKRAPNC